MCGDGFAVSVILPSGANVAPEALMPPGRDGCEVIEAASAPAGTAGVTLPRDLCAMAMNAACAKARGDVLAFVAPQIAPRQGWADAVRAYFAENPDAEAVTGATSLKPGGPWDLAAAALDGACSPGARGPFLHCAVRRQAFEERGGFDESLPALVTLRLPLGGLPLTADGPAALCPDMAAVVSYPRGVKGFFAEQFTRGEAAYLAPARRGALAGILTAGEAPVLALRFSGQRREAAPVFVLATLGAATRLVGWLVAFLRGGRTGQPVPGALLGPESDWLVAAEGGASPPAVSVVVPAYGRPPLLGLCLGALVRQDVEEAFEVIVVADGDGGRAEALRGEFPRVCLVRAADVAGPGDARNVGIDAARGHYVAFTDADCLPAADWLRRLLEACRRRGGRPVCGWVDSAFAYSYAARAGNVCDKGMMRPSRPVEAQGVGGSNFCISHALLKKTGARFAEKTYGAEEASLLHRLSEGERSVLLEPAARVRHLRRDGVGACLSRHYRLGRGSGRMRRRFNLRGSAFARRPWLSPLLAPLRFLLTAGRAVRYSPLSLGDFVRLSPFIACCYLWYSIGFMDGALEARRQERAGGPAV